ncbi:MAG: NAD(P)H-hydrate dehydratase [Candidatus Omnitrophica bacterium]|nr:NAD(P)H-hydrate dehydratase [Candidatus Omnitrophota bacterium]
MRLPTRLLRRRTKSHKGDFGHILILGGSAGFSGAAALCAEACIRSGAGVVTLGIPKSINSAVIKIKAKEVITLPLPETKQGGLSLSGYKKISDFLRSIDCLIIGPGLGVEKTTQTLVRKLLAKIDKPAVVDADGLNAIVGHLNILRATPPAGRAGSNERRATIITPHPGEMGRLVNKKTAQVLEDREGVVKEFVKKNKVTLVLKGHHTLVADDQGNFYTNRSGNPGMATAGSGDVLSGVIGAFLGQGLNLFDAAKYAVYLHGVAGDLAAKQKTQLGMIASDITANIPEAIRKCS